MPSPRSRTVDLQAVADPLPPVELSILRKVLASRKAWGGQLCDQVKRDGVQHNGRDLQPASVHAAAKRLVERGWLESQHEGRRTWYSVPRGVKFAGLDPAESRPNAGAHESVLARIGDQVRQVVVNELERAGLVPQSATDEGEGGDEGEEPRPTDAEPGFIEQCGAAFLQSLRIELGLRNAIQWTAMRLLPDVVDVHFDEWATGRDVMNDGSDAAGFKRRNTKFAPLISSALHRHAGGRGAKSRFTRLPTSLDGVVAWCEELKSLPPALIAGCRRFAARFREHYLWIAEGATGLAHIARRDPDPADAELAALAAQLADRIEEAVAEEFGDFVPSRLNLDELPRSRRRSSRTTDA